MLMMTVVLIGCSGQSVAHDMYDHLEKTAELEQPFAEQQEDFANLENEEQDLYNQMIELSADEMDEINSLSEQALATIEERIELLTVEKESMEEAEAEFAKVKEIVGDLEEDQQESANALIETMDQRYDTYKQINDAYAAALDHNTTLYELMMDEDLTEEELKDQVDVVNQAYDEIISLNDEFNEYTDTYNEQKRAFYEATDLNVSFE